MRLLKSDLGLIKIMFIGTLVFLGAFYYSYYSEMQRAGVAPEVVWGGPIPTYLTAGRCFHTEDGLLGQFLSEPENTKINIVVAGKPLSKAIPNPIEELRQALRNQPTELAPFIVKYLSSKFDLRRATDIQERSFDTSGGTLRGQSFRAKKEEHYAVAIGALGDSQQIAIEGFTLNHHVSPELLQKVIKDLPLTPRELSLREAK